MPSAGGKKICWAASWVCTSLPMKLWVQASSPPATTSVTARNSPATATRMSSDLFAVAMLSPTRGLRFATSFVRDRATLQHAIYALQPANESDPLGMSMSATSHNQWQQTASSDLVESLGLEGEAARPLPVVRRTTMLRSNRRGGW